MKGGEKDVLWGKGQEQEDVDTHYNVVQYTDSLYFSKMIIKAMQLTGWRYTHCR